MSTLGNKISSNRKQLNMTQEDLANKLNVSAQAVIDCLCAQSYIVIYFFIQLFRHSFSC